MRANILLGVSLTLAAVLIQAGCSSQESGAIKEAAAPRTSAGARSGGSSAPRTAKPPANTVTLPVGTPLAVRTTNALSSSTQETGQTFTAHLEQSLVHGGREIAPKGSEVEGRIVEADKGGRVDGRASLAVQMIGLHTAGGQVVEISTNTITHEARATKGRNAATIGIGSGVGAAIGAAAGAGGGTGVVLATRGDPAVIPSETVLSFALRSPVTFDGSR